MKEFTSSQARQQFAALLDLAGRDGAVRIRRRDGQVFVLSPDSKAGSPLDVPSIHLEITADEIVGLAREGRRFA